MHCDGTGKVKPKIQKYRVTKIGYFTQITMALVRLTSVDLTNLMSNDIISSWCALAQCNLLFARTGDQTLDYLSNSFSVDQICESHRCRVCSKASFVYRQRQQPCILVSFFE